MDLSCWELIGRHFEWTVEYFFFVKTGLGWLNNIYELLNNEFQEEKDFQKTKKNK